MVAGHKGAHLRKRVRNKIKEHTDQCLGLKVAWVKAHTTHYRRNEAAAQGALDVKERAAHKHGMLNAVVGGKLYQRTRCGMRSFCNKVLGVCHGRQVGQRKAKPRTGQQASMEGQTHEWALLAGGLSMWIQLLLSTLCCECAGWTTSNRLRERLRNPCEVRDPRVANQLRKLEQGIWLSRTG